MIRTAVHSQLEGALARLASSHSVGPAFFEAAAQALANSLGCCAVEIARFHPDIGIAEVLATIFEGQHAVSCRYGVDGTPCGVFYRAFPPPSRVVVADRLVGRYPDDSRLSEFGAVSFWGEPFFSSDGRPAGHVALLWSEPLDHELLPAELFDQVRQRIQAEFNRWQSEEILSEHRRRYELALKGAKAGLWDWNVESGYFQISQHMLEVLGLDDAGVDVHQDVFLAQIHPQDRARFEDTMWAYLRGHTEAFECEYRTLVGDSIRWIYSSGQGRRDPDGRIHWVSGSCIDITERKDSEEALCYATTLFAKSEERHRAVVDGLLEGVHVWSIEDKKVIWATDRAAALHGFTLDEYIGKSVVEDLLPPREAALLRERQRRRDDGKGHEAPIEHRIRHKSGEMRWVQSYTRRILWDGAPANMSVFVDITERQRTQEQLVQAQKMEAVGQLTGGVAHDFNNLIAVVLGNLELLESRIKSDSRGRDLLSQALSAAERGAALTQRLLAFSRKQILQPETIEPGELVLGLTRLLSRTLGEAIEVRFVRQANPWYCVADPHQLETAILNLAINARDAMPNGGRLTIETSNVLLSEEQIATGLNVAPGDYVLVAIHDTGLGMKESVRRRVFEPFFTTKSVGKGSGLGLSMVYGFVRQSNGHVEIDSTEGDGTSVKMYLPRERSLAAQPDEEPEIDELPLAIEERVLVVEDDPAVRVMVVELLSTLGYFVLEAGSAEDAHAILHSEEPIDLLITDMVLPGSLSGHDVAIRAQRERPGLKTLYMTGYTDNPILRSGTLGPGLHLLRKPFRKASLARKVREVLEGPAPSPGGPLSRRATRLRDDAGRNASGSRPLDIT